MKFRFKKLLVVSFLLQVKKKTVPAIPTLSKAKSSNPFFTTKLTGQETGLDLSLSYDIVKAHGGALKVETKVGAGSKFFIQISITWKKNTQTLAFTQGLSRMN